MRTMMLPLVMDESLTPEVRALQSSSERAVAGAVSLRFAAGQAEAPSTGQAEAQADGAADAGAGSGT